MHPRSSVLAVSIVLALSQFSAVAATPTAAPVAASTAAPGATVKAPLAAHTPSEWIAYDDTTYTPVLDDVSRALADARSALGRKDHAQAAQAMQSAARALKQQADTAARLDRQRAAADLKLARDTRQRLNALAGKLEATASQIQAGRLPTTQALDQTLGKAARADLERRWLVTDVTTWFPVVQEPQSHFTAAAEALVKKDYQGAAAEVRKAGAYVRLEAARAVGESKKGLAAADADLARLGRAIESGATRSAQDVEAVFARTQHALALAHRARAAEAWAHKAYDKAGYELKAAAHGLESAAHWSGREASTAAYAAAADAQAVGDKLAQGGVWARDEVAKGFESLGNGINHLGQRIGSKVKARAFDVGA